jgi:hypothetical protein
MRRIIKVAKIKVKLLMLELIDNKGIYGLVSQNHQIVYALNDENNKIKRNDLYNIKKIELNNLSLSFIIFIND